VGEHDGHHREKLPDNLRSSKLDIKTHGRSCDELDILEKPLIHLATSHRG
jgi:hypothetical protein